MNNDNYFNNSQPHKYLTISILYMYKNVSYTDY